MRLTRQAALAIALVAGLLAALLAWVLIGQGGGKPKPKAQETIEIPVPLKTIPAGTELQAAMFRTGVQAKDLLTANVVTDAQALVDRIAVQELAEGQPVRVEQVQERSARLGMAYALNPGLRGMAVSLDIIGTAGDFIKPLDHVDVLTSFRQDSQVVVRTLVQDVVVLAIGQAIVATPPPAAAEETSETKAEPAAMRKSETPVTLALTPAQAQIILTADQAGDLRLTLRAKHDSAVVPLPTSNSWSMVGAMPKGQVGGPDGASASGATPQPAAAEGPPPDGVPGPGGSPTGAPQQTGPKLPKQPYVEVIRGGETEIVVPQR